MSDEIIVKTGLVGQGLVGPSHFKGYQTHPNAKVTAVCDLDRERAETFAKENGVDDVYTSYEEMLANADINTVDLAAPTFLHVPMTIQAANAGKHIHVEKPFSRSIAEGKEAVEAVKKAGVKLVVGETYIFNTSHVKARELINAGEIGKPLQVRQQQGSWVRRKATAEKPRRVGGKVWRHDPALSGGGNYPFIFGHAVHYFALAEYVMQDQRIEQIHSVKGTHATENGEKPEIPFITWTYENTDCQGVWMRAERGNGKFPAVQGFSTQIICDKGMIEVLGEGGHNLIWEGEQQHLVLHCEGKNTRCFRFDEGGDDVWDSDISYYGQGHINQVHHLIDSIIEDKEPDYSGEEGVHAVRCTLASIRSAEEGRPISLNEIEDTYTAYGA